jgi:glycosyltransferase involved in cell wall biosynthesis
MPVRNGERYIGAALDSVLNQGIDDLELIVSDNASTDSTPSIVGAYASREPRVKLIRQPQNIGVAANYNVVYRHATGRYFKWASANDICGPRMLLSCVSILEENQDVVLAYPMTRLFSEEIDESAEYTDCGSVLEQRASDRFVKVVRTMKLNNVLNGVFRTDALHGSALHRPFPSSDVVLVAELALKGTFVQTGNVYFYRRMNSEAATRAMNTSRLKEYWYPNSETPVRYATWKYYAGMVASVMRSAPDLRTRASAGMWVLRNMVWSRRTLMSELFSLPHPM